MEFVGIGSLAAGVALTLYVLKKKNRTLIIAMIITGYSFGRLIGRFIGPALNAAGGVALAGGVPAILATAGLLWVCIEIKERKGHRWSPWIALVVPILLSFAASTVPLLGQVYSGGHSIMESSNSSVMRSGR